MVLAKILPLGTLLTFLLGVSSLSAGEFVRHQAPEFLTFEELKQLSREPNPGGPLKDKLEKFWTTPIINNEAYYQGVKPHRPQNAKLGPYVRVAQWNVEKSIQMPDAIKLWSSPESVPQMIDPAVVPPDSEAYNFILYQRDRLTNADVIILQEMDIGVKRSGYLDAAAELAKALSMNYAYGAEQLEIDPVRLGLEKIFYETGEEDTEAEDYYRVNAEQYKGVFGSAVLSRYPIKKVEVFQLKNQGYDWYWGEKPKLAFLEKTRRFGTKILFKNELTREMKVGGRIYMRVDLEVPELPDQTLTVINVHLEIKCQPKDRERQMLEILSYIGDIRHPVILAGDFNSAAEDLSPTSLNRAVKRTAANPTTWFSAAISYLTPYGMTVNPARLVSNVTKNFQDPLAKNIPVIAPNSIKPLFEMIKNFRFLDGGAFDFRGDKKRSINQKDEPLANSNQRDFKGFKTTFSVRRPIGIIGKYRLDWIFVKSFLRNPEDLSGSYRFAPHFGETLEELNTSLKQPISDHHPSVVDLPFERPKL